jgi:hypothetical protein
VASSTKTATFLFAQPDNIQLMMHSTPVFESDQLQVIEQEDGFQTPWSLKFKKSTTHIRMR